MRLPDFTLRVYYEDTDAAGIVYYANYLKFAERARTEALRACGIEQTALMREQGIGFVVRRCEVDYLKPAVLDDCLTITTQLHDINRVSLNMEQVVRRGNDTLATLKIRLAVIGANLKPARLPDSVRAAVMQGVKSTKDE